MPNEGFLQRWSRLKAEPGAPELPAAVPAPAPVAPPPATEAALPTLADAARLDAQVGIADRPRARGRLVAGGFGGAGAQC